MTGRCAHCSSRRPLADLLAYWPRSAPDDVRFVCRPSLAAEGRGGDVRHATTCFGVTVGSASRHGIAPAVEVRVRAA